MFRERQISWLIIIIIAIMLMVLGVFADQLEQEEPNAALIMYITAALLTFVTLLFYQLDTRIDNNYIYLRFGLGLIKKKIDLSEVKSVTKVRNKWWYGWGIRLTPEGWLWNIRGLDAVELRFEGDKRKFRIGTQHPEQLADAIRKNL